MNHVIELVVCVLGGGVYGIGLLFLGSARRHLETAIKEGKDQERRHKEHISRLDDIAEEIKRCTR